MAIQISVDSAHYMETIDRLFDFIEKKTEHSRIAQTQGQYNAEDELAEQDCLRDFFCEIMETIRKAEEEIGLYHGMSGMVPAATRGAAPGHTKSLNPFHHDAPPPSQPPPTQPPPTQPPPTQPPPPEKHGWLDSLNPFHHDAPPPSQPPPTQPPPPEKHGWLDSLNPFHHDAPPSQPPPPPPPEHHGWLDSLNPFHHDEPPPQPAHEELSWFEEEAERLKNELKHLWPFEESKPPPPPSVVQRLKQEAKDRFNRLKYIGADSWLQKKFKRIKCCAELVLL